MELRNQWGPYSDFLGLILKDGSLSWARHEPALACLCEGAIEPQTGDKGRPLFSPPRCTENIFFWVRTDPTVAPDVAPTAHNRHGADALAQKRASPSSEKYSKGLSLEGEGEGGGGHCPPMCARQQTRNGRELLELGTDILSRKADIRCWKADTRGRWGGSRWSPFSAIPPRLTRAKWRAGRCAKRGGGGVGGEKGGLWRSQYLSCAVFL